MPDDEDLLKAEEEQNLLETIPSPDEARPTLAPAPTPSPYDDKTPYSDSFSKGDIARFKDTLNQRPSLKQTETKPLLYSTAPDWYQGGAPPKKASWAADLVRALSGAIAAPAAVAAQDPNRPLDMKMEDARQSALAQGLGGLLTNAINSKQNHYAEDLDAARAQASMMHAVPGRSQFDLDQKYAGSMFDRALKERSLQSLEGKRGLEAQGFQIQHDPNSPEAEAAKKILIDNQIATPEQLRDQTLYTMTKQYPMLSGMMNREGIARQHEADALNKERQAIMQSNLSNDEKARQLQNVDKQRQAQAYLGEDYFWLGGTPPDEVTQRKARELIASKDRMLGELDQMKGIQARLNQMKHGFAGTFDEWLGRFEGTPEGQEAQRLVAQAQQIRQDLMIAQRNRANMGVPQEWEQRLVGSLIPQAGSIQGWLKGGPNWDAFKGVIENSARTELHNGYGVGQKSMNDIGAAAPEYDANQRAIPGMARVRGRQVQQDSPDLSVPVVPMDEIDRQIESKFSDVPTEPVKGPKREAALQQMQKQVEAKKAPAPPQKAPGVQTYKITPAGGGKPFTRDMTPEEAAAKQKAAGTKFKIEPVQ